MLTQKQQRFVDEYLVDLNATQAAIRAGYSEKTAKVIGSENLSKPAIRSAIQAGKQQLQAQTGITKERVLRELGLVGFGDIRKLYDERGELRPIHELSAEEAAQLAGVEVQQHRGDDDDQPVYVRKIKRWDKVKALELLGRHLGLWSDPEAQPVQGPGMVVQILQGTLVNDGNGRVLSHVSVDLPGPQR